MKTITNRQVLGILIFIAILSAIISALTTSENLNGDWLSGLMSNLGTEMVGAVMTYGLFEIIIGGQEKQKQQDDRKQQLIREMGGSDNAIALRAVRELEAHGWLEDGSLQGASLGIANLQWANLSYSNLQQAYLERANLQEANLGKANLRDANLSYSNLQGADLAGANLQAILSDANLQEADLAGANLQWAYLGKANLQRANLGKASLQRANLGKANLQGANLAGAKFDEKTILPDASVNDRNKYDKYWTPQTDMTRYTDPNHPDFWQPDWVKEQQAKE